MLAAEGACVQVNYDTLDLDFICSMMEACERSACICSIGLVAKVPSYSGPQVEVVLGSEQTFAEVVLQPCRLSKEDSLLRKSFSYGMVFPPGRH
jgi:hypothetical protein